MKHLSLFVSAIVALSVPVTSAQVEAVGKPAPIGAELTRKSPYSMIGQTIFRSGQSYYEGSGTVVYSRSVLTAAHTLWDPTNGWSTDMQFNRARSGASIASRQFANRLYVFGSYRSVAAHYGQDSGRAFASDLGGMRFNAAPAGGACAGWRADTTLLGAGTAVLCLGYGAEFHSGDDLLSVRTSAGFFPVNGAFLENTAVTFEGGMSGGPILSEVAPDDFRVVGVVVAGSDTPPACGIRALDAAGAAFIATYLRY
ncbi:MAG: hypothetical protein ABI318_22840 [Chthoniobacteraceae bacterium]